MSASSATAQGRTRQNPCRCESFEGGTCRWRRSLAETWGFERVGERVPRNRHVPAHGSSASQLIAAMLHRFDAAEDTAVARLTNPLWLRKNGAPDEMKLGTRMLLWGLYNFCQRFRPVIPRSVDCQKARAKKQARQHCPATLS